MINMVIRKEKNGLLYMDKNFFDRFSEEDLEKYGYTKVEAPEDCEVSDFNDDLTFSIEKYNQRLLNRKKQELRIWREKYFNILDRATWFDSLTNEEKIEVHTFRKKLLDLTITLKYPEIPKCVLKQMS